MHAGTVVIGGGQAGFEVAASLRADGYQEPITIIGEEQHLPYQRPPLSKGFILGKDELDAIELRPSAFYRDHQIDLMVGDRAVTIETAERRVDLASGGRLQYESLVLAVGARNRQLAIDGAELDGVVYLRTLDEAQAVKERIREAQQIVVIGGGFIGLELGASARSVGKPVTVLEAQSRLMPRAVEPILSVFFRQLHQSRGVAVVCDASVCEIVGEGGKVRGVRLNHGASYPADLVLVGIGVVPNAELALDAGLAVSNGVVVDEHLQTADPRIYAIGDCAEYPNAFAGRRVRLESVQNAADQGRAVAAAILGRPARYEAVPWFWTDQFDVRLQMAGFSQGYDRSATRGNPDSGKFSVYYFKAGQLVAVDSIGRPLDHIVARKLLTARAPVTPEQAADEDVDLRKLART